MDAILFDMDGTLLPMDNDVFTKEYLKLLAEAVAPLGYEYASMCRAMWKGVAAMVQNDGSRRNCEAFWEVFGKALNVDCQAHIPYFDEFYTKDFHKAIAFTQPTDKARLAVDTAKRHAKQTVLATNPLFPRVAVVSRLSWAGLREEDFDLITDYENFGTCKPNPEYYRQIVEQIGVDPARCLMVGNNAEEDIAAAQAAGLSTFLLTDCLIPTDPMPSTPQGDFDALLAYLEQLPE